MWLLLPDSLEVEAQWINTDGTRPNTVLISYYDGLYFTGDSKSFQDAYGATIQLAVCENYTHVT